MGGIIRGDVVDSTDVYAPKPVDQQNLDQQRAEEERRRREAEEAKKKQG